MSDERIDELIALAVSGELSAGEQAELDALLEDDESAARELHAAASAAAELQSGGAVEPPAALRARVMDEVAVTEQVAPAMPAAAPGPPGVAPPVSLDAARRRRMLAPLLAAAAAVVVVIGVAAVALQRTTTSDPIAAVLDAEDVQARTLTGEFDGAVTVSYSTRENAMVVEGVVPQVDDSRTYQLWLVDGERATSVGLFRPDTDGKVSVLFDGITPGGAVLGVTEEPAGGSEAPTLPILLSA
jgi:anti-sigma-K factor RskA